MLISLSIGLVVALMFLSDANPKILWINWAIAGVLSTGIWHIVSRFRLDGGASVKAFAISWPLLTLTLNFTYCYFPLNDLFYKSIIQQLAMLAFVSLEMSLWQRHKAIIKHILLGLIIGLTSTLIPHTILWIFLLPIASYYMRSWSIRNMMSAITGILMGIWVIYLVLFFGTSMESADQMFMKYVNIVQPIDFSPLIGLNMWQYIFLGFIALLLVIYSFSGLAISVGQSIRAEASIILISALSLALGVLSFFDIQHFTTYIGMLSLFLSMQLTIHQANLNSAIIEWWILFIILVGTTLCILPLFIPI
jgi:hypothetical protein